MDIGRSISRAKAKSQWFGGSQCRHPLWERRFRLAGASWMKVGEAVAISRKLLGWLGVFYHDCIAAYLFLCVLRVCEEFSSHPTMIHPPFQPQQRQRRHEQIPPQLPI